MTDVLTSEQRSRCMAAIRSKDTKPEMRVRRLIFSLGYRYRLHCRDIPGKPDIVLRRLRKVVFVHGCFWHRHKCRYGSVRPKANAEFWEKKLSGNAARDRLNRIRLRKEGWECLVIWECQLRHPERLLEKIVDFLDAKPPASKRRT